jgi:hypothetical protein
MVIKWLIAVIIILVLIGIYWVASYGDWHLKRNRRNFFPKGQLIKTGEMIYLDEGGISWELQPDSKNLFHQPDDAPVPPGPRTPYPNVSPPPDYKPDYPNLKFLSMLKNGDSAEAILQPDGTWLNDGPKMGTYNYFNPAGFKGYVLHVLLDVIPHLFNADYEPTSLNSSSLR